MTLMEQIQDKLEHSQSQAGVERQKQKFRFFWEMQKDGNKQRRKCSFCVIEIFYYTNRFVYLLTMIYRCYPRRNKNGSRFTHPRLRSLLQLEQELRLEPELQLRLEPEPQLRPLQAAK